MLLVYPNTDKRARLNMKINSRAYFFFASSSQNFALMMSHSFYLSIVTRDNILINGKIYEKREMLKQESVMLLNKSNLVSQQCIAF